ncbi:MAG: hypothetical protein RLY86_3321 [Pseudomonadota bacterium]|jgi:tRNA(fMet)-specific endonuclease VapC
MYLLDTNVCIALLTGVRGPVRARVVLERLRRSALFVSSITVFELRFGIEKGAESRRRDNEQRLDDFIVDDNFLFIGWTNDDAAAAARIRDELRRLGRPIGPYDTLIAGQAMARGLTVVTANTGEFARIPGLPVEDWSAA